MLDDDAVLDTVVPIWTGELHHPVPNVRSVAVRQLPVLYRRMDSSATTKPHASTLLVVR